jgi:hypothetical protein
MPYYRKLPSGLWQATVRGRDGSHIRTDKHEIDLLERDEAEALYSAVGRAVPNGAL